MLVINNYTELDIEKMSQILIKWYDVNARILPWRNKSKNSPYHIWISEIMLQQTTVKAVIPKYKSFIKRWPNIKKLSLASIDEILHEWQGLGYYTRAHNIFRSALIISKNYNGRLPKNIHSLKELPGIGDYTAGAVASIAFSIPVLPVDVNIERVLARINGLFKNEKNFKSKVNNVAKLFYESKRPGDLTQSFMDFGAIICKPNNPLCEICPLSKFCLSFRKKIVGKVPGKKYLKSRKKRYGVVFFVINNKNQILFRKRKNSKILRGMMELPMTPLSKHKWNLNSLDQYYPIKCEWEDNNIFVKAPISGFQLEIKILFSRMGIQENGECVALDNIGSYAIPSIFKKIINKVLKELP